MARSWPVGNGRLMSGTATVEDLDTAKRHVNSRKPRRGKPRCLTRVSVKPWTRGADVRPDGPAVDLTYDYDHLADSRSLLNELPEKGSCDIARNPRLLWWAWAPLAVKTGRRFLAAAYALDRATKFRFMRSCTPPAPVWARFDIGA